MDKSNIREIVIRCINNYLNSGNLKLNDGTSLLGGELDSLGLVNVIIDIEVTLMDKGINISLASEKMTDMETSPFKTIGTLTEFIYKTIK